LLGRRYRRRVPSLTLKTVAARVEDRVGWLVLNRPAALNAWTRELGEEALAALAAFEADPEVRAVAITGAGRAFSAGADLNAGGGLGPGERPDVGRALRDLYNPLILRVRTIPKPVLAAVNGAAVGVGCSLALACDLVIASAEAYFLLAFVNVGLGLDGGASLLLPALVGHARAFELAYLGERLPAARALDWGLVNEVVAPDQLERRARELAARLAAGPPGSLAAIKRAINAAAYDRLADQLELEARLQQERASSRDFAEGVLAFAQKRPPRFTGE
jgi:2-(1,2-epoxy-1,2-dihydrophenyl)acetyl-CoA isomerase